MGLFSNEYEDDTLLYFLYLPIVFAEIIRNV
jgi:hypothetical protein